MTATPAIAALIAFAGYVVAYRFYSTFLAKRIFQLDGSRKTPAHTMEDGVDYVPTKPVVLFGHHYASITGLAPMLGPAVAVIWGWLPAICWVVGGAIFVGCVHDFSALVISIRAKGMSVGKVAEGVVGRRARTLFLLIIFFGVSLAMGVFVFVIARLFAVELTKGHAGYPQSVFPSAALMLIALAAGLLLHANKVKLWQVAVVGFALELGCVAIGLRIPTLGLSSAHWPSAPTWTWILLAYAFAAAVLPVWALLQSRDFLNALLLYLGLILAYAGLFVGSPRFDAPALVMHPEGAPPLIPFVFIIIACGAASGFHGLVSSGTTAKQLGNERHARPIGYGAMIGESLLGLLATLACTAGFGSSKLWHTHYASWSSAHSLPSKIDAFIQGATRFVTYLGIPESLAAALIAMVVVSFALTTLDSATRLLRFNIEELGSAFRIPGTQNRYLSSILACAAIAFFAFYKVGGKPAALALWALFGTTNQLLAGLTLGLATLYLKARKRPVWYTGIPTIFMLASTLVAMVGNLRRFATGAKADPVLFGVGGILFLLALWLLVEAVVVLRKRETTDDPAIRFA